MKHCRVDDAWKKMEVLRKEDIKVECRRFKAVCYIYPIAFSFEWMEVAFVSHLTICMRY